MITYRSSHRCCCAVALEYKLDSTFSLRLWSGAEARSSRILLTSPTVRSPCTLVHLLRMTEYTTSEKFPCSLCRSAAEGLFQFSIICRACAHNLPRLIDTLLCTCKGQHPQAQNWLTTDMMVVQHDARPEHRWMSLAMPAGQRTNEPAVSPSRRN